MLLSFREHIKGWVAGIIFGIISLTFLLWGVQYYMQSRQNAGQVVASVNGHDIQQRALDQQFQQYQQQNGFVATNEARLKIKNMLLAQMIQQYAILLGVKSAGFVNTDDMFANIMASAFVTPQELQLAKHIILQHSHIGYLVIPLKRFAQKINITDHSIQQYYLTHKEQFQAPARVKVAYLQIDPSVIKKDIKISDQEAEEYYQANIQQYTKPAEWQVKRFLLPLSAGASAAERSDQLQAVNTMLVKTKDFNQLLKKYTKATVLEPTIHSVNLPPSLLNVLSSLQVGNMSSAFVTQEGINVFKLIKYTPPQATAFPTVKQKIKNTLTSQQVSARLTTLNQNLSDLTYTNPGTLSVAAKALHLKVKHSNWLSLEAGDGIFSQPSLRALAFSNDVLVQGNNSNIVSLANGNSVVIRVQQHQASKVKPLADVKGKIIKTLKHNDAQHAAAKEATLIQKAFLAGKSGPQIAADFKLDWQQYRNLGKANLILLKLGLMQRYQLPMAEMNQIFNKDTANDKTMPAIAILQASFQSPATAKPSLGFNHLANGDYVITQLLPADDKQVGYMDANQNEIENMFSKLHAFLDVKMLSTSMQQAVKVKRYPAAITAM